MADLFATAVDVADRAALRPFVQASVERDAVSAICLSRDV